MTQDDSFWLGFTDSKSESSWRNIYKYDGDADIHNHYVNVNSFNNNVNPNVDYLRINSDGYWIAENGLAVYTTVCAKVDRCLNPGYILLEHGVCYDIDECNIGTHDCPLNSSCVNQEGTFSCICDIGYIDDGNGNCADVDECADDNPLCIDFGRGPSSCVNTDGSYTCEGQILCVDQLYNFNWSTRRNFHDAFDHCADIGMELPLPKTPDVSNCFANFADGNYWIGATDSAAEGVFTGIYDAQNIYSYFEFNTNAEFGFGSGSPGSGWPDLDFLRTERTTSDETTVAKWVTEDGTDARTTLCVDLIGCLRTGFHMVNSVCYDINECILETHTCGANANCINIDESFECECPEGFTLNEDTQDCDDVDECAADDHGCDDLCPSNVDNGPCPGVCVNTVGSYGCTGEFICQDKVYKLDTSEKRNFWDAENHCRSKELHFPAPRN